jgi:hypothetical protein
MKLTTFTCTVAIVFTASAFAVDDRIAQDAPAPQAKIAPGPNYDQALRDSIYDYENDTEAAKTLFWVGSVCSSDGLFRVAAYTLKQTDPNRAAVVASVRASMHKYLLLAKDPKAADKIWQDWHDIPDSEKANMGHLDGKGFDFANDLATDCFLARTLVDKGFDRNCSVNGEPISFQALNSVCLDLARHSKLR